MFAPDNNTEFESEKNYPISFIALIYHRSGEIPQLQTASMGYRSRWTI